MYKRFGDTFTQTAIPSVTIGGSSRRLSISSDDIYLATVDDVTIYKSTIASKIYKASAVGDLMDMQGVGYVENDGLTGETVEMIRILK